MNLIRSNVVDFRLCLEVASIASNSFTSMPNSVTWVMDPEYLPEFSRKLSQDLLKCLKETRPELLTKQLGFVMSKALMKIPYPNPKKYSPHSSLPYFDEDSEHEYGFALGNHKFVTLRDELMSAIDPLVKAEIIRTAREMLSEMFSKETTDILTLYYELKHRIIFEKGTEIL